MVEARRPNIGTISDCRVATLAWSSRKSVHPNCFESSRSSSPSAPAWPAPATPSGKNSSWSLRHFACIA